MGISERRMREKEMRRNAILDAAEQLFFSRGIEHTTMDDVAEAAEFSKGTLYLYFKNKEDLLHGIYLRGIEILKQLFQEALATPGNGLQKVNAIGEAYFRFSKEYPNYFRAMNEMNPGEIDLQDTESNGFRCHLCTEEVMQLVARAVQIGIDDGSIRKELDPHKTAYLLWAQTAGLIQVINNKGEHMRKYHHIPPDDLIPALFDMIRHGLKAK